MREYNIAELKSLIREAYLEVLTEDAESSNRKKARRLLKDKNYVTRDNFKAGDEEERIVINTLPDCVRYNNFKFAIFFYSLYYQYKDDVKKDNVWKLINTYFFNILKEEGDNFDYTRYLTNKNDYTLIPLQDLLKKIEEYNSNKVEDDNQDYNASEYPYNGYKIVKILTFEQSQEYSKYCSWCVTKSKELYNRYTNNGLYCFHYCLRYDYKDTNEPLSMLAVLVDEKGGLRQVTTRTNNGDHYYKTEQEVEQHFGIDNFNSVFKAITEEEIKQYQEEEQRIKNDYRKNIKKYLKQGHNIEDILRKAYDKFEYVDDLDLYKLKDNSKCNFIDKEGNLLSNGWYDDILYENFINLIKVKNNDKYNYIDKHGDLLFTKWYDGIKYDKEADLFRVQNKYKQNYIDTQGNLLFTEWYEVIKYNNTSDLFWIKNNNKENYINKEGNLFFNEWYKEINYNDALGLFEIENYHGEHNFIDKEGNLLFNEWLIWSSPDKDTDLIKVKNKNSKYNYIDTQGNLLFTEWYEKINYNDALGLFVVVNNNSKCNYIDTQNDLLFTEWYDSIWYDRYAKLFKVRNEDKKYYIDIDSNLILNGSYDEVSYDDELDLFSINDKNKENYIDKQGNLLFNEWYNTIYYDNRIDVFYIEKSNHKWNIIDKQGNLLSNEVLDKVYGDLRLKKFIVKKGNKEYYFDTNKKLIEI